MFGFTSAHLLLAVHAAIVITVIEVIVLTLYHAKTKRGVAPRDFITNITSGLCLMLALRSVLVAAPAIITALWLFVSGLVHVAEMFKRWK